MERKTRRRKRRQKDDFWGGFGAAFGTENGRKTDRKTDRKKDGQKWAFVRAGSGIGDGRWSRGEGLAKAKDGFLRLLVVLPGTAELVQHATPGGGRIEPAERDHRPPPKGGVRL